MKSVVDRSVFWPPCPRWGHGTSPQEKLNHPPFTTHLIPCLVNVFIAVEKAVMSYYDLSYRYKYELRIPVMELFDLALQHEDRFS